MFRHDPAGATGHEPLFDRSELLATYRPLVDHAVEQLVTRYPSSIDRDRLYEAGLTGLASAAAEYESARGDRFSLLALSRIREAMIAAAYSMVAAQRTRGASATASGAPRSAPVTAA